MTRDPDAVAGLLDQINSAVSPPPPLSGERDTALDHMLRSPRVTVLADLRGWVLARVDGVPPTEVLLHSRMWEVDDWMTVTVADYLQWMKNISDGIARNSFHPFTIERRDGDRVVTDEVPAQDILDVLRAGTAGWVRGLDASAFEGLSMTEAVDLNLIASRYGVDLV